jgi:hypothetical protein
MRGLILAFLILLTAACVPVTIPAVEGTPATETGATTPTSEATTTMPEVTNAEVESLMVSLTDTIPLRSEGGDSGFDGVNIFAVETPADAPRLWVAHTYGIRSFDPLIDHFVALYTYADGSWNEVARHDLECPDYVDMAGVNQVAISPDSVWLTVDGGAGAHSGCFALLRWEGEELTLAVQGFNSSPGAGDVADLDGDGQLDVILNGTEPYIFCYACGVRLYAAQILRWTGEELVAVELARLPEEEDATLRALNNDAVALAEASLYPDALALIREALTMAPDNDLVYWNAQEIELYAANRLFYAEEGAYPLLGYVFYGDYAAALDEMRGLAPEAIFSLESPLIVGTPAEMWVTELSQYLIQFASGALDVQADLAAAYFLRGWGRFLADPTDPAVLDDVAQAALLAPDDLLIVESYDYLQGMATESDRGIGPIPVGEAEAIRFAPGATADLIRADLGADPELVYWFEVAGGQTVYITAPGDVTPRLLGSAGQSIPGVQNLGATRFEIPSTGVYTLILQGNRPTDVLIYIPPMQNPAGIPGPASTEQVRFAAGTTSATLDRTLQEGLAQGFLLGISGGQRLFVSVAGNASYALLDPQARLLTPIRVDNMGDAEYLIPFNGDYTVLLWGSGAITLTTEIP